MQARILFWDFRCIFILPKAFFMDIKVPMFVFNALFPPESQTSSHEAPTETLRQTVIQAINKISAMS